MLVGVAAGATVYLPMHIAAVQAEKHFETAAAIIHNAYRFDSAKPDFYLPEEAIILSEDLDRQVSATDVADAVTVLDGQKAFCKDDKPANLKKFRKILRAYFKSPVSSPAPAALNE